MPRIFSRPILALACACMIATGAAEAQSLRVQPTPFSVWLDFQAIASSGTSRMSLPIWMESLQSDFIPASPTTSEKTVYRIRLRRLGHLNGEIQLRLFFDDKPGESLLVTGWTETGTQLYTSAAIGSGLGLPTSESIIVPVAGLDYVDIEAPGDGRCVRGAFVATLRKGESRHALDFEPQTSVADPFANVPSATTSRDDTYLFGRVRALLDPGPFKLDPASQASTTLEFELESKPLLAVISFEVLDLDPLHAPEITINDLPLGRASAHLPDLADPAFQGKVRALDPDMNFHYAGWVRCQIAIPGSALNAGINTLVFELKKTSSVAAVRAVEIELKHPTQNLDYQLVP